MTRAVRVTPRAFEDLQSIATYTRHQWGETQQRDYLQAIDARFRWLAEQPARGMHRPEIAPGYFSFPEGRHVIFCLVTDDSVDIIGVPHQSMDLRAHFQP